MIDGRFDQHFLEIFAQAQSFADAERRAPWTSVIAALVVSIVFGAGAVLLTQ